MNMSEDHTYEAVHRWGKEVALRNPPSPPSTTSEDEEPSDEALSPAFPVMEEDEFNWARKLDEHFAQPTMSIGTGPYVRKVPKSVFSFYYNELKTPPPSGSDEFWSTCAESIANGHFRIDLKIEQMLERYDPHLQALAEIGDIALDDETDNGIDYSADAVRKAGFDYLVERTGDPHTLDVVRMGACLEGEAPLDQMIYGEGQLVRCILTTEWPTARMALLKMWAVLVDKLYGFHAVKQTLVDIKLLAQFNMVKQCCSGAEWMIEAAIKMYKAKMKFEQTWMRAIDAVGTARAIYWGDIAFDSLMCGLHGRGCSKWSTEPRDCKEGFHMKLDYFYVGRKHRPIWPAYGKRSQYY